jgi:hypothetical protein
MWAIWSIASPGTKSAFLVAIGESVDVEVRRIMEHVGQDIQSIKSGELPDGVALACVAHPQGSVEVSGELDEDSLVNGTMTVEGGKIVNIEFD